jgi:transcriptional regulator with XRE-family HTH domain
MSILKLDFNLKNMSLHTRVRELCKALKLSQANLAETLGLRQPQLNGYLNEKS